jgi:hypothetical protein
VQPLDSSETIGNSGDLEDRVQELLRMFDLLSIAEEKIGDWTRDSSSGMGMGVGHRGDRTAAAGKTMIHAGHIRLITIAMEMSNRPGLIYMEDPIHGLAWPHAQLIASAISSLAQGKRTVLATLSRPTDLVFQAFDHALLLGTGLQLYFGPRERATVHFMNIGFEWDEDLSAAEYLLQIAGERGVMKRPQQQQHQHQQQSGGGTQQHQQQHQQQQRGKSSVAIASLSLEDLADLCRSMTNMINSPKTSFDGTAPQPSLMPNSTSGKMAFDATASLSTIGSTSSRKGGVPMVSQAISLSLNL